jgi:hypothetical protein
MNMNLNLVMSLDNKIVHCDPFKEPKTSNFSELLYSVNEHGTSGLVVVKSCATKVLLALKVTSTLLLECTLLVKRLHRVLKLIQVQIGQVIKLPSPSTINAIDFLFLSHYITRDCKMLQ